MNQAELIQFIEDNFDNELNPKIRGAVLREALLETVAKLGILTFVQRSGADIEFDVPAVYNTPSSPVDASITWDPTGATPGFTQKIYMLSSDPITFPAEWKLIGEGYFVQGVLNIVYAEYVESGRVEYSIIQEQSSLVTI
ncbi:MAG: hypothetical protein N4A41_05430 [Crocinitomicaceae bacterium]|jgi:hypothetical protein|nr:hypothetical protein [Crocinitomicaceae bacterium]